VSAPYEERTFAPRGKSIVDPTVARVAFLSLFRQKIELPAASARTGRRLAHSFVAILAGTSHEPVKIERVHVPVRIQDVLNQAVRPFAHPATMPRAQVAEVGLKADFHRFESRQIIPSLIGDPE